MAHDSIGPAQDRNRSFAAVSGVYAFAVLVGWAVWAVTTDWTMLRSLGAVDAAGTLAIFAASFGLNNTSVYDAYWSVAPPFLLLGAATFGVGEPLRAALLLAAVSVWALRLTANWARGWGGLHEEDWRYADFRRQFGTVGYWLLSLFGLHGFPTLQVFLGLIPGFWAVTSSEPLGVLGWLGAATILGATALEAEADRQLHRFLALPKRPRVLRTGLWARSRHPNYLGELGVWLGVLLMGLDAGAPAWTSAGFLAMAAMFRFVSVPLIERRHLKKRPEYAEVIAEVPMLLPKLW